MCPLWCPPDFNRLTHRLSSLGLRVELKAAARGETPRRDAQKLGEIGEGRVAPRQIVERGVAGVAGIAMLPCDHRRPASSSHRKRADRMARDRRAGRVAELGFIELGDEERADRHAGAVRLNDGPRNGVDSPIKRLSSVPALRGDSMRRHLFASSFSLAPHAGHFFALSGGACDAPYRECGNPADRHQGGHEDRQDHRDLPKPGR